ncbi:MAG: hypothetical protein HOV80_33580 [Polyangiaceae bacterium]|nr:hypothetical protein [Polyangiaceae bacterium]
MTSSLLPNAEQKQKHIAWAKARLRSSEGKAQLRKNLEAGMRALLAARVETAIDVGAAVRVVEAFMAEPFIASSIRPILRTAVLLRMARLREAPEKLGTYVSPEAKELMDRLLERPGLLPEKLVRELLTRKVFEEIARDVLDDALDEFSSKVNPFTAEWGLPSLLKRMGPLSIGLGAFAKGLEAVREEFDKRLEPERRKFLQSFARRSLDLVADFVIRRSDEPAFIAARKELLAWLLEQPVGELVSPGGEKATELAVLAGEATARHLETLESTHRQRKAAVEMLFLAHKSQTLEVALATYGAKIQVDWDALTDAIWPSVKVALDAPEVDAFVEDLVGGFYDEPA